MEFNITAKNRQWTVGLDRRAGGNERKAALCEIREEAVLEMKLDGFLGIYHSHDMLWSNGDAASVICVYFVAVIISGESRINDESYELYFFRRDEIPKLFAERLLPTLEDTVLDIDGTDVENIMKEDMKAIRRK